MKQRKRTKDWVGPIPYGIGEVKPNHFAEMAKVAVENRAHPLYAWRILRDGTCDGCALGTVGLRDFTMDGIHLCTVRLNLLKLNNYSNSTISSTATATPTSGITLGSTLAGNLVFAGAAVIQNNGTGGGTGAIGAGASNTFEGTYNFGANLSSGFTLGSTAPGLTTCGMGK